MRQSNCGWGTTDHAKLAAPCPLLLALDRPSPGLIQELAAFSYEHACCLLQRQAHATSGRHDRKPQPATPYHPAGLCQQAAAVAGGPRKTRMLPAKDNKKDTPRH